jgi:hypothetical protein
MQKPETRKEKEKREWIEKLRDRHFQTRCESNSIEDNCKIFGCVLCGFKRQLPDPINFADDTDDDSNT